MPQEERQIAKNMMWNTVGSLLYLGCQWIVTILVTRIAGFYDAGLLSVAMSVSSVFQTVAMFGIRNFQVSDIDGKYTDGTYVGVRNLTCTASLVFCVLFSLVIGYGGEQFWAIFFFMLFRIAESYSDVLYGIAQKKDRLDIAGKAFAIKGILLLPSFFIPYLLSSSLWLSLAFMAASSAVSTLLFDLRAVQKLCEFRLLQNIKSCVPLIKEALPLFVYLFLFSSLTAIPKLFLERMYDETSLGAYSSIFSIALLFQMATGYVYTPFVHIFAKFYKDRDLRKFVGTLLKVLAAIVALAIVTLLLASFLGEFALALVFGESILPFAYLLSWILLAVFVLSFLGFLFMLEIVIRDFTGLLIGNFVGFLACICLSPVFIKWCGLNGTSISLVVSACVALMIVSVSMLIRLWKKEDSKNGY